MTNDPGMSEPCMPWKVRLVVAYLSLIRRVVARRILPLSWARRLGAPFRADDARRTNQDHDSTGVVDLAGPWFP